MTDDRWIAAAREAMTSQGLLIESGLSESEIDGIETDLGFRFPAPLRALLREFLPAGPGFPNWRQHESPEMLDWLDLPAQEVESGVLNDELWRESWGERPDDDEDAADLARGLVAKAPVLIPVWDDCYVPAGSAAGSVPVISVAEGGVSMVAPDLGSFFLEALGVASPADSAATGSEVEFWSDLSRESAPG